MAFTLLSTFTAVTLALVANVNAESHTVSFDNRCGRGTPTLIQGGNVLSTGEPFTSNGALSSFIAYLQTGECLFNGEGCTLFEASLQNPTAPGSGSSADISLIAPHAFNVAVGFSYDGSCASQGTTICSSPSCDTAFFKPDDTFVQVACQDNDVNLLITFCPDAPSNSAAAASFNDTEFDDTLATSTVLAAATAVPARNCVNKRNRRTTSLESGQGVKHQKRTVHF